MPGQDVNFKITDMYRSFAGFFQSCVYASFLGLLKKGESWH